MSIKFLTLRRFARSGAATIMMSSAPTRTRFDQAVHTCGTSRTMHGNARAQDVEDGVEGIGAEIVDALERRRRGQQAQMIGALREQAIDESGVDALGREHGVGDALRRVLVVVEAGGAERQIEIGDDGIELEIACDRPGDVVRDRRCADAALGADDRDGAADRLGVRRREQAGDRADDVDDADRRNQVVADLPRRTSSR